MSKVFSAKRQTIGFKYEFLDGKQVELELKTLSTKKQKELQEEFKREDNISAFTMGIKMLLVDNGSKQVQKIIDEQYEDGDIAEFWIGLNSLIKEAKEKK